MNILLVNWQDRGNPHAGGAEIHLFEIFGRLAARGHRIRLVASGWRFIFTSSMARAVTIAHQVVILCFLNQHSMILS